MYHYIKEKYPPDSACWPLQILNLHQLYQCQQYTGTCEFAKPVVTTFTTSVLVYA